MPGQNVLTAVGCRCHVLPQAVHGGVFKAVGVSKMAARLAAWLMLITKGSRAAGRWLTPVLTSFNDEQ